MVALTRKSYGATWSANHDRYMPAGMTWPAYGSVRPRPGSVPSLASTDMNVKSSKVYQEVYVAQAR